MDNLYTEKKLKPMNKTQLFEIAAANGIEVNDGMKNNDIITLILAKNCPLPDESGDTTQPPDSSLEGDKDSGGDVEDEGVPKFSKEQLLKSNWYSHRRDVLNALLDDGKQYSHAAVRKLIDEFMKGKVK